MPKPSYAEPKPGQPVPRRGKVYIWTTWLAKLLGGDQCVRSVWFKGHYQYAKLPERDAEKLVEWNRDHTALMRAKRAELEANGWTCQSEQDFKLEGDTAIIAGKEDLIATMPGRILIVDGKTGRRRDSDFWQVLIYLYARLHHPRRDPGVVDKLAGEVFYRTGAPIPVRVADVQKHEDELVQMVHLIAADEEPAPNPSRYECQRCNIGPKDCPKRWSEQTAAEQLTTGAF